MSVAPKPVRLIFAGGGTGGHLFPAVAIADRIRDMLAGRRETEILFAGTKRGLEYRIRDSLGYPLHLINVRGLVRSFTLKNLLVPFLLVSAMMKAGSLLDRFQPDMVIGTGGYVSLPVLKAATARNIMTVVQEQNSFPGMATRRLAVRAVRVYLGFAEAQRYLRTEGQFIVSGNPVRRSVIAGRREDALEAFGLNPNKKTVLVLGGSQGARSINDAVLKSLSSGTLPDGYQLLWQTGKRDYRDVIAQAGDKVKLHALFPFEDRMELVYAAADLAIARAGALTLAELQACGIPSLLIPYPYAAGDHQMKNAAQLAASGFARLVRQTELEELDLLGEAVSAWESGSVDRMHGEILKANAGRKPAVDIIAGDIVELLEQQIEEGSIDA